MKHSRRQLKKPRRLSRTNRFARGRLSFVPTIDPWNAFVRERLAVTEQKLTVIRF